MPLEARFKNNNDKKCGPILIFASEENTLRTSLIQHQRLVVGGHPILEDCFKGLAKCLFLFHRVPQAKCEGSLGDLKFSAPDEIKECIKTRGAFLFI